MANIVTPSENRMATPTTETTTAAVQATALRFTKLLNAWTRRPWRTANRATLHLVKRAGRCRRSDRWWSKTSTPSWPRSPPVRSTATYRRTPWRPRNLVTAKMRSSTKTWITATQCNLLITVTVAVSCLMWRFEPELTEPSSRSRRRHSPRPPPWGRVDDSKLTHNFGCMLNWFSKTGAFRIFCSSCLRLVKIRSSLSKTRW